MRPRLPFRRIDLAEAEALLHRDDVLLLDIRDAGAFATAHLEGAVRASHGNLSEIIAATPRHRPVLIYCYHGHASQEYAQTFSDFGFTQVYSLDGGYEAWRTRPVAEVAAPASQVSDPVLGQWLTDQGFVSATPDARGPNQITPLMVAAHAGAGDMVRRLLAAGAALDARNGDGNTAIWLACVGRHLAIIDQLVAAGIDPDTQNDTGATALMYAASAGLAEVVAHLLACGADPRVETPDGFTALDLVTTPACLALLRPPRAKPLPTPGA